MAVLQGELALQLGAMPPLRRQVGEQAQAGQAVGGPVQHFGVLEVEALAGQRVERLEQAFLQREGQGDGKAEQQFQAGFLSGSPSPSRI